MMWDFFFIICYLKKNLLLKCEKCTGDASFDQDRKTNDIYLCKNKIIPSDVTFMGYAYIDGNFITKNIDTDEAIVGSPNSTKSDESDDDVEEDRGTPGNASAAVAGQSLQNLRRYFSTHDVDYRFRFRLTATKM